MAFTGGSRDMCIQALNAANGNADLAFEFVMSGNIPQPRPQNTGAGGAGGMGGGANPLQAMMQQP